MSDKVFVLYKISNMTADTAGSAFYNAFYIPRSVGVTLSTVKQHCRGLAGSNSSTTSMGNNNVDGYHWRVRVDDKPTNNGIPPSYTWWDIQDENARLPVREVTYSELNQILSSSSLHTSDTFPASATDVAKGAMRTLGNIGKAMNKVAATVTESTSSASNSSEFDQGPRIPVIVLKLIDMLRVQQHLHLRYGTPKIQIPSSMNMNINLSQSYHRHQESQSQVKAVHTVPSLAPQRQPSLESRDTRTTPPTRTQPPNPTSSAPSSYSGPNSTTVKRTNSVGGPIHVDSSSSSSTSSATPALMDFGPNPTGVGVGANATATSTARNVVPTTNKVNGQGIKTETPAQRLKREYQEKAQTENRVWDEVDQRWVTVPKKPLSSRTSSLSHSSSSLDSLMDGNETVPTAKVAAISLDDTSNAIGKSATVVAAVQARVLDLKATQQRAVEEVRAREQAKKEMENEEDAIRARFEPIVKQWAEEHGKKKQLRALLSSLHTILWPEAQWKPVNLGDILDDKKLKLCFHKASRVVHPDKTLELSAENRFLAKRIFDALSQAKADYDDGKK